MPLGSITQFAHGGALTADNINAPVNSLKGLVDAFVDSVPTTYVAIADTTTTAVANKLLRLDGFSAASIKSLTIAPINNGQEGLRIIAPASAATGLNIATFVDHDGTTPMFALAGNKKAFFYGDVSVAAGSKYLGDGSALTGVIAASVAAGNITGTIVLPARSQPYSIHSELAITPSPTAMAVRVAVGNGMGSDQRLLAVTAAIDSAPTSVASLTTGQTRVDAVVILPGTPTPTVSIVSGTPQVAATLAVYNTSFQSSLPLVSQGTVVGWIFQRQGATSITQTDGGTQSYLIPATPFIAVGASGGGGSGGAPTAGPYFTYHTDGTLSSEMDLFTWMDGTVNTAPDSTDLSGKRIDPVRVKWANGAASLKDVLRFVTVGLSSANISIVGGNTAKIDPGSNPISFVVNGDHAGTLTTAYTTAAAPGGGGSIRNLVVDLSGSTPTFTLLNPSTALGANQYTIAQLPWNGTTLFADSTNSVISLIGGGLVVNSASYQPAVMAQSFAGGNLTVANTLTAVPTSTAYSIDTAVTLTGYVEWQYDCTMGSTAFTSYTTILVDGGLPAGQRNSGFYDLLANGVGLARQGKSYLTLTPGHHTIQLYYFTQTVPVTPATVTNVVVYGEFHA